MCAHCVFHTHRSPSSLQPWEAGVTHAHFTDEKSEAQRGEVTCPKSPSQIQTQVCPTLEARGLSSTCCLLGSAPPCRLTLLPHSASL